MSQTTTTDAPAGLGDEALSERVAALELRLLTLESASPLSPPQTVMAGELLRRHRRHRHQSQAEAALDIGVNQSTVSKWERGDRIGWDHTADVATYLGISPAAFLAVSF